jgi:hypothetical protein
MICFNIIAATIIICKWLQPDKAHTAEDYFNIKQQLKNNQNN